MAISIVLYYIKNMYFATAYAMVYAIAAVLIPYAPILLRGMGYGPSRVGILLGLFDGAGIAGPLIFSYLADKKGQYKSSLLFSHLLVFLPFIPLLLFRNMFLAAALLMILGIGFRSIFPLLDVTTTFSIGPAGDFGKIRLGAIVGFSVMSSLLQVTPWLQPNSTFNITFWICISVLVSSVIVGMIPSNYIRILEQKQEKPQNKKYNYSLLILGLIMIALSRLGMVPAMTLLSLYVTEYLEMNVVGLMWTIASLSGIPVLLLAKKLINRFGSLNVLMVCILCVSVRLGICALFPTLTGLIASQLLHSITYSLFYASGVVFVTECVPPHRRALGMSLLISIGTGFPTFAGNILGGIVIEQLGYRALFGIYALFPVLSLGIYVPCILAKKGNKRL